MTDRSPDGDQTDPWLRPDEAASRLGTTIEAVRSRIRRGKLQSRRGNDGRVKVLVPMTEPDQTATERDQTAADHDQAETDRDWLRVERNEALIEADHWRRVAEDERTARVKAEAGLAAHMAMLALERARADRIEAALAEARRPWAARLVEALRGRR